MFLPWYEMRTALLRAIVARHELQLSGRRPCATRSLLISVCWYDPTTMDGAATVRVTGAAFGAGAGARRGLGAEVGPGSECGGSPVPVSTTGPAAAEAVRAASPWCWVRT